MSSKGHLHAVPATPPLDPKRTPEEIERDYYHMLNALPEEVKRALFKEKQPEDYLVRAGRSAIIGCHFGFGITVKELDGKPSICVDPHPIWGSRDGPALREFMEDIAVTWLRKVAPHRLAEAFQSED